jgi:sporulation protein YlmC with PRC-barrel domain
MTRRLRLYEILGMHVRDADGADLGTVHELKAERRGDALCVTALVVGNKAFISRVGWGKTERGTEIPWERVAAVGSGIVLRRE